MEVAMAAVIDARARLHRLGSDIILSPEFIKVDTTNTLGWESVFIKISIFQWHQHGIVRAGAEGAGDDLTAAHQYIISAPPPPPSPAAALLLPGANATRAVLMMPLQLASDEVVGGPQAYGGWEEPEWEPGMP